MILAVWAIAFFFAALFQCKYHCCTLVYCRIKLWHHPCQLSNYTSLISRQEPRKYDTLIPIRFSLRSNSQKSSLNKSARSGQQDLDDQIALRVASKNSQISMEISQPLEYPKERKKFGGPRVCNMRTSLTHRQPHLFSESAVS